MVDKELEFKVVANTDDLDSSLRLTKREIREAGRVVQKAKEPWEKYGDELERVNRLEQRGALTARQAANARQQLGRAAQSQQRGELGQAAGALGLGGLATGAGIAAAIAAGFRSVVSAGISNVRAEARGGVPVAERLRLDALAASRADITRETVGELLNAAVAEADRRGVSPQIARVQLLQELGQIDDPLRLRQVARRRFGIAGRDITNIVDAAGAGQIPRAGPGLSSEEAGRLDVFFEGAKQRLRNEFAVPIRNLQNAPERFRESFFLTFPFLRPDEGQPQIVNSIDPERI